ncbi:MAG: hypothetical protein P8Y24_14065 [Gammaproteobacteria bacterium]
MTNEPENYNLLPLDEKLNLLRHKIVEASSTPIFRRGPIAMDCIHLAVLVLVDLRDENAMLKQQLQQLEGRDNGTGQKGE